MFSICRLIAYQYKRGFYSAYEAVREISDRTGKDCTYEILLGLTSLDVDEAREIFGELMEGVIG